MDIIFHVEIFHCWVKYSQYMTYIYFTDVNSYLVSFSCTCSISTLSMPWTEQKSGTLPISDLVLLFILLVLPGEAQIIVYISNTPLPLVKPSCMTWLVSVAIEIVMKSCSVCVPVHLCVHACRWWHQVLVKICIPHGGLLCIISRPSFS